MIKLLDFSPYDNQGEPTVRLLNRSDINVKLASDCAWAPEIREFIASLKPVKDKLFALINAMGATEFFSCNRNGDAFYEDALKKYHHTFTNGHPFMHHINKDPEKAYGRVIKSAYNDIMHRVELIVEYDLTKLDPKFAEKINNGEMVNVSMGCRVDSDFCSICNNRAKTPAEYCEHLRDNPGLGKMLPDGRKAFAINRDPEFFDISIVTIPADPTARVLTKIAHTSIMKSSCERAAEVLKTASGSEVKIDMGPEECSCGDAAIGSGMMNLIKKFESLLGGDLSASTLDSIGGCSDDPFSILNSFIKNRVYLRPNEVQRIVLVSSGMKDVADSLDRMQSVMLNDPTKVMKYFADSMPDMGALGMLPESVINNRTLSPDNIKKITLKIILPLEKTGAAVMPVHMSDDFKYLLGQNDIEQASSRLGRGIDSLKTYLLVGSLVSAFGHMFNKGLGADLLSQIGVLSGLGGPKLLAALKDIPHTVNDPVQEMQFMNPNSPEAVEAALTDAIMQVNMRNMTKRGSLERLVPKTLLSVPLAYGASKLITNEAKNSAMEDAQFTGKYSPGFLSRPEIAFPLSLAVLLKFASAEKTASEYVKSAAKAGMHRDKESVLNSLHKVLFK